VSADVHRLYLLRHAKSSWSDSSLNDHDRPLAGRGRKATDALREHCQEAEVAPQLVLCSSAQRAVETFERVRPGLPANLAVSIEEPLYAAGARALLSRLRKVPDDVQAVLLVAHNPGVEDLLRGLAGDDPRGLLGRGKYPTGALATLTFHSDWRDLGWGKATLEELVVPREL
jgi:phosphohistidine phosphatase